MGMLHLPPFCIYMVGNLIKYLEDIFGHNERPAGHGKASALSSEYPQSILVESPEYQVHMREFLRLLPFVWLPPLPPTPYATELLAKSSHLVQTLCRKSAAKAVDLGTIQV